MKPSIRQLVNLVCKVNSNFDSCRLVILSRTTTTKDYVVDISDVATENLLTFVAFREFFKFEPSFELYNMDEDTASYYGVEPGQYLSLSFQTK